MAFCDEFKDDHPSSVFGIKEEDDGDFMEFSEGKTDITKEELEEYNPEEGATSSNGRPSSNADRKVCSVCGRSAKSSHFGALCCDSCRAFFRRNVQNSLWETFICFKDGHCDIVQDRRSCQRCSSERPHRSQPLA
ncbi:nuclear hormone receptor family member nhr-91-like [Macrobrachium nipponense]|uniref:nuclear hormone receptor family member nhr-91-like n=1 Tax=Macrobrachium nipponense TaxID=159736 RepID=UPI0030C82AFE